MAARKDSFAVGDRPTWLNQVLGTASPPFTFRRGGSAITGGAVGDTEAQQTGSNHAPSDTPKSRQRG